MKINHCARLAWLLGLLALASGCTGDDLAYSEPGSTRAVASRAETVAVLVDPEVMARITAEWQRYQTAVTGRFPGVTFVLDSARAWSQATPVEVRGRLVELRAQHAITGAILAGKIPLPLERRDTARSIAPLYYENLDDTGWSEEVDADGRRVLQRTAYDPDNPTEIWTAWWVPPLAGVEPGLVAGQLQIFLAKAAAFHEGQRGSGSLLFTGQDWGENLQTNWVGYLTGSGAFAGTELATARGTLPDWNAAWRQGIRRHVHVISHGDTDGLYLPGEDYTTSRYLTENQQGSGANLVTFSGCSLGNIDGGGQGPARSLAAQMVFHPQSPTITTYGSVSPQTTGVSSDHTPLFAGLKDAFFAAGYHALRNTDIVWNDDHFMFRTRDDKCLVGDPFLDLAPGSLEPPLAPTTVCPAPGIWDEGCAAVFSAAPCRCGGDCYRPERVQFCS